MIKKINYKKNIIKLKKLREKKFAKKLFDILNDDYKLEDEEKNYILDIINYSHFSFFYKILDNNRFIDDNIIEHFESHDLIYSHYSYNKINIHLYNIDDIEQKFNYNIDIIFSIILSLSKINTNIDENFELNLIVFFSNLKKHLPKKNNILSYDSINSGMCEIKKKTISIWRKEEFYFILIHELIHFFELDKKWNNFSMENNYINSVYNIQGNIIINEAITDTLAYLYFCKFFKLTQEERENEIIFSLIQVAKILNHFDFQTYEELFKKNNSNKFIKQKTAVFSYYILKSKFLFHKRLFYNFITDKITLMDLLKEIENDNEYSNKINYYLQIIINKKIDEENKNLILFDKSLKRSYKIIK